MATKNIRAKETKKAASAKPKASGGKKGGKIGKTAATKKIKVAAKVYQGQEIKPFLYISRFTPKARYMGALIAGSGKVVEGEDGEPLKWSEL